jgi:hypothetical protein
LGMVPAFASGLMCGVERRLLSIHFFRILFHSKEGLVSDYLDFSSSPIHWNPSFIRDLMIGSWNLLTSFSIYYTPLKLIRKKWIICCGHHLAATVLQ